MRKKIKIQKKLNDLQAVSFPVNYFEPTEKDRKEISAIINEYKKRRGKKTRLQKIS